MKKYLVFVLATLFATSAFAQITINSEHAPAMGTTMWSYGTSTDVTWSPGSGSNQTWNINSFEYFIDGGGTYFLPSTTPYASTFPTATHCLTAGDNTWSYIRIANNGMYYLGFVVLADTLEIIQASEPEALLIPFPCTMGTNWISVIRVTFEVLPGFETTTIDSTLYTVDGWGTMTTPAWSQSALRVADHSYNRVLFNGMPIGETTENWSYSWFTQDGNHGASYSNFDATGPNFTTGEVGYTSTGGSATDPTRGPVAESFSLSQNYPNPFNPTTTLPIEMAKSGKVEITIYNEMGQIVHHMSQELTAGSHALPIDGSAWSTGSYFAKVMAGNEVQTTRMVLIK